MVVIPIDVLPYVRGIQVVLSGYEGYTKGKRREADKMIKAEIKRAATRARNHIINIQDSSFKSNKMSIATSAKLATTEIDYLIQDVNKSTTSSWQVPNNYSLKSFQESPSRKTEISDH